MDGTQTVVEGRGRSLNAVEFWGDKKVSKTHAKLGHGVARKQKLNQKQKSSSRLRPPASVRESGRPSNTFFGNRMRADAGQGVSEVVICGHGLGREKYFQKRVVSCRRWTGNKSCHE